VTRGEQAFIPCATQAQECGIPIQQEGAELGALFAPAIQTANTLCHKRLLGIEREVLKEWDGGKRVRPTAHEKTPRKCRAQGCAMGWEAQEQKIAVGAQMVGHLHRRPDVIE
jgi:hypothetical protein